MNNQSIDQREQIYQDLHSQQLEAQEAQNRHSAETILGIVFDIFQPNSVLDVGCGLGTWLSVVNDMNVSDIMGIDGSWLDISRLRIPPNLVRIQDLEKPLEIGRKFDLLISLEVAEHLHENVASNFIDSLTNHADIILFSAAIPFQGGHHHVNEQFPDYWCSLFRECGFEALDFIRPQIWNDNSILWWLKQNILLFVKRDILDTNPVLSYLHENTSPLSIVHPDVYLSRLNSAYAKIEEYNQLINLLSSEGLFSVKKQANGNIMITTVGDHIE